MTTTNQLIDFKAIAAATLARADMLVAQWLPGGKREGYEYKALNPLRSDRKPGSFSINLNTGAWADFATDDCGGDLISLYAYLHGMEQIDAARAVAGFVGIDLPEKSSARKGKKTAAKPLDKLPAKKPELKLVERTPWQPILPVPEGVAPPPVAHIKRGKPSHTWTYRDAEGRVLGYVCRFETSDGGKEVLPLTWCHNPETGAFDWRWVSFPEPRPLYGLDRLHAQPTATVLVVEGEKCADAGADELNELVVISWAGGGKAVDKADWQPLAGRQVMGWADCDAKRERLSTTEKTDGVDPLTKPLLPAEKQPGVMAMEKVAAQVMKFGNWWDVKIPAPGDKPDGWDIADAIADGLKGASLAEFLRTPANRVKKRAVSKSVSTPTDASAGKKRDSVLIPDLIYKKGDLANCLSNVYQILAHRPEWLGVLAYDEFCLCVVKRKPPPYALGKEGEWDSTDDTRAAMWLSREYQFTPSSATVAEAVEVLARAHAWHPVRAWLRTLPAWDAVPRLKTWLTDYLGVPFSGYSARVGVWWLMGAVKRVLVPGCKFDYCLVLEGNQGKGKSTVFEIIGGEWFGDTDLDLAHKDSMSALRGKVVYEIAELGALARSEEKRQKSFLSRRVDEYRPVYGRREIKAPRQLVFGGSTNDFEWNKDPTGGRRFWPVDCTLVEIDHAGLRSMRDLLFAEAYARVEAGERYWPTMDEQRQLFDPEQLKVEQQDSLVDALHDWVYNRTSEFSQADAMMDGLKLDASKLTRDLQTRIGIALRKLGCARVERRNGMTRFVYKPPERNEAESSTGQSAQQGGGYGYVDF